MCASPIVLSSPNSCCALVEPPKTKLSQLVLAVISFFPAERLSRLAVYFHELKIRYGCLKYFVASMSMLHRSYRPKSLDQHVISFSWIGPISCLSVYIFSDMCHQLKFIDSSSSTRFCDETVQIRQNGIKWSVIHCFLRWQWPFVTNPKVEQWIRPSTFFWTWRKYSI